MKPEPRNIALDLILTLLLCGLWNLVVQHEQIKTINYLLKKERFNYWRVYLYSLLTCGIYLIVFEYQKAQTFNEISGSTDESDTILAVVLSILGLHFIFDAILQSKINQKLESLEDFSSSQL